MKENQYPYNEISIKINAPLEEGVYVIDSPSDWIYVGQSSDIQERLLAHCRGESDQSSCIDRRSPETFDYEIIDREEERRNRERELIRRLKPWCNRS